MPIKNDVVIFLNMNKTKQIPESRISKSKAIDFVKLLLKCILERIIILEENLMSSYLHDQQHNFRLEGKQVTSYITTAFNFLLKTKKEK